MKSTVNDLDTDNDLFSVVNGYKIEFMWWTSLKHDNLVTVSCCFSVVFLIYKGRCNFFPKFGVFFSSRFKRLVMWQWSE